MNAESVSRMTDADLLITLCGQQGRVMAKQSLPVLFGFRSGPQKSLFAGEEMAQYVANPQLAAAKELFLRAMHADMQTSRDAMSDPSSVRGYLCGRIGALMYEVFVVMFLDAQNRLIAAEEMFRGTLTQTSVYPREIVKRAIEHNAASVIFAHNHPSGNTTPSRADEQLTCTLKSALQLIDIRVLDHVIVSGNQSLSFAEHGLI